ncbi:piggyBac transposable element-derived protein 3 [Trichonephila inaurata madagascariensis]|uniref:PiggyBac transposable element-derived protein 3 n=1 Tax=Trichonephila inaurata madagascariensis TaxID=2747483 RepID=A0A8X6IMF5_9ARAC|nr:piggyBac transposable element-derived protein 3 [Trichonephila inaurata madagascariensis]
MNRDGSDLSSLSDEDDYQGDNGSEMDDDDEDQDVTFDFSAPPQQRIHTDKFNPVSFDFQEVGLPSLVKNYNDYMGGIDHLDRTISFYRMKFRTKKCTVRVILHMIDFTTSSAWIAYRNNMTELEEPKKDILYYFAFGLSIGNTLIYG